MVFSSVTARRLGVGVILVQQGVEPVLREPAPPQVLHVDHLIAVSYPRPVAADDVRYRRWVQQGGSFATLLEFARQFARDWLDVAERHERPVGEQRRFRWMSPDETGRAGRHAPVHDRVVHRDVVAAAAPSPRAIAWGSEDPEVVKPGIPPALPPPVAGPLFHAVQDVFQPHHGRYHGVAFDRKPGGEQLHGKALLPRTLLAQRQAAVISGRVKPRGAFRVVAARAWMLRVFPLVIG